MLAGRGGEEGGVGRRERSRERRREGRREEGGGWERGRGKEEKEGGRVVRDMLCVAVVHTYLLSQPVYFTLEPVELSVSENIKSSSVKPEPDMNAYICTSTTLRVQQ